MKLILARIGNQATICFAVNELEKYLKKMDPDLFVEKRVYDSYRPEVEDVLWVGLDGSVALSDLDEIRIAVENGSGILTGSSERAVLIAGYRFLQELGCAFLHPGETGEIIPLCKLEKKDLCVQLQEQASYRHRSMCIEGSVSYEHVYNMIDWLPKVGMCGYFMQFHIPSTFFKRFYNEEHINMSVSPVSDEDVAHLWKSLEEEIAKRGLDYHATGHGWTCEPFGIHGTGWEAYQEEVSEEAKACLALVNGKRELWENIALNTNLCYSQQKVRDKMTDAIVSYCKEHTTVNYLHFWLADGSNNHCECEECRKKLPSDYYVILLNELDEKLTAAGVDTKIVCLIYVDLLWAPQSEKIKNPDRFVLMFAPITRTYTTALSDADLSEPVALAPYERNRLTMPKSVAENIARLRNWQKEQLDGDSFDFDYHLMWNHYTDPGYYECAKILHRDMANLDRIGLNGMVSCQVQRAAFPTGLPMYAMAKALWNKKSQFEDVACEYFSAAFGEDGQAVEKYLSTLSELFDPAYVRRDKPLDPEQVNSNCAKAKQVIDAFQKEYLQKDHGDASSWKYLNYHAQLCLKYIDVLKVYLGTQSDEDARNKAKEALLLYAGEIEKETHQVFDFQLYRVLFRRYLK